MAFSCFQLVIITPQINLNGNPATEQAITMVFHDRCHYTLLSCTLLTVLPMPTARFLLVPFLSQTAFSSTFLSPQSIALSFLSSGCLPAFPWSLPIFMLYTQYIHKTNKCNKNFRCYQWNNIIWNMIIGSKIDETLSKDHLLITEKL